MSETLAMQFPQFQHLHYSSLDSTNEEAKRLLAQQVIEGPAIIRADAQTAGKGTQGRVWASPPQAGLYCSIVHPAQPGGLPLPQNDTLPLTPLFTLAAGVACAQTIQDLTGLTIQLKPINDLYVDGRKLGGILTESLVQEGRCKALITGIGINIASNPEMVEVCQSDGRGNQPISLQDCIAAQLFERWNRQAILQELANAIAVSLHGYYAQLLQNGEAALLEEYDRFKLAGESSPTSLFRI